jgi:allantoinase
VGDADRLPALEAVSAFGEGPKGPKIATGTGVPTTDFSDNRVMRSNPRDLYDAHMGTFRYLRAHEPMSLLVIVMHCQFGGRPLITAVMEELLGEFARSRNVWFARHEQLADWALERDEDELDYESRFFDRPAKGHSP